MRRGRMMPWRIWPARSGSLRDMIAFLARFGVSGLRPYPARGRRFRLCPSRRSQFDGAHDRARSWQSVPQPRAGRLAPAYRGGRLRCRRRACFARRARGAGARADAPAATHDPHPRSALRPCSGRGTKVVAHRARGSDRAAWVTVLPSASRSASRRPTSSLAPPPCMATCPKRCGSRKVKIAEETASFLVRSANSRRWCKRIRQFELLISYKCCAST